MKKIKGGVPQGSKLGPIVLTFKINQLSWFNLSNDQEPICEASEDEYTVMFIDYTTLLEVIIMSLHSSGSSIDNTQRNVNSVVQFAQDERMDFNWGGGGM